MDATIKGRAARRRLPTRQRAGVAADDRMQSLRAAFRGAAVALTEIRKTLAGSGWRELSPSWRFYGPRRMQGYMRTPPATAWRSAKKALPARKKSKAKAADDQTEKMIEDFMRSHGVNRLQAILALRLYYLLGGPQ
jgi:hypothetical protein